MNTMLIQRARLYKAVCAVQRSNKGFYSTPTASSSAHVHAQPMQPPSSGTASVWEAAGRILEFAEKDMTPVTLEYLLDLSPKNPRGCALYVFNELPIRLARRVQGVCFSLCVRTTG